jgi:hypothetical protein
MKQIVKITSSSIFNKIDTDKALDKMTVNFRSTLIDSKIRYFFAAALAE